VEPRRLILVPQLPVHLRYSSWWIEEFEKNLKPFFSEVIILGSRDAVVPDSKKGFSSAREALLYEARQVRAYMDLDVQPTDVLLQLDLSFPGLFHEALYHAPRGLSATFCHASARNRFDCFQPVRASKWASEKAHAKLYTKVLVASEYHRKKLGLPNAVSLGALPNPPTSILPEQTDGHRGFYFASVARPCIQKTNVEVERELRRLTGKKVHRYRFLSWEMYYKFLDRSKFLIITSREDTYGYQAVDAILRGCVPIAPRAFSFPELLPKELLYDNDKTFNKKAKEIVKIAEKWGNKKAPRLLNEKRIKAFFPNLVKELLG
jgi:hypothetical protein